MLETSEHWFNNEKDFGFNSTEQSFVAKRTSVGIVGTINKYLL